MATWRHFISNYQIRTIILLDSRNISMMVDYFFPQIAGIRNSWSRVPNGGFDSFDPPPA